MAVVDVLVLVGAILAVLLVLVYGLRLGRKYEQKRTDALAASGRELGLELRSEVNREGLPNLRPFPRLNAGGEVRNLLQGKRGPVRLSVFDHRFSSGAGGQRSTVTETVIHLRSGHLSAPVFSLLPGSFLLQIASVFGYQDIGFDTHPKFTKAYVLRGKDEAGLRAFFTPTILEYFELHPGLSIETAPGEMIVFRAGWLTMPQDLRARVEEAFELHELFRRRDE